MSRRAAALARDGPPADPFVLSTFMKAIPWELSEAARVDGAGSTLIVYLALQRQFVAGLTLGAGKGRDWQA